MAFGAAAQRERSIPGAVATLGVSDRVAFLRKTYALLGGALIVWAAATAALFRYGTETSLAFSRFALGNGGMNWLIVIGLLMVSGMVAQWLARSEKSRAVQYLGLAVLVGAWTFLLQPILWILFLKFHASSTAILGQAALATITIFAGLTATVFITKKDFTFLRGIVTVGMFAALGLIGASVVFGFTLGTVFIVVLIGLLAMKILSDTSAVLSYFPPTHYVSAALLLFSSIATLFWNILQLLMASRR